MKRIIRITLSLPLCAALLLCAVFPAGAVMALLWQVGDADMDYDIWADDGQSLTVDEGNEPVPVIALIGKEVRTGYIAKDTINPPQMMQRFDRDAYEDLYICVTVRDAEGRVSDPVTAVCYQYQAYM